MATYFVVNATINDKALLDEYIEGTMATVGIVPLKILAMDNECEVLEGTPAGTRTVIVEFESKDDFRRWYDSPEYQAVISKRFDATTGFGVVAQGM